MGRPLPSFSNHTAPLSSRSVPGQWASARQEGRLLVRASFVSPEPHLRETFSV